MSNTDDLIKWKTNAWKDPNMVAWYAGRMVENSGTNMLKNALEANIIAHFATGKDVLDVGIGTGRGSIPLARAGMAVTGIDSSQAMLDETRRQAGRLPMTLKQGDVMNLPVPDQAFDYLISLNVMVHFPHWREVLAEWKRVMRPGGRILFDIHSLDHLEAVYGKGKQAEEQANRTDFGAYMSHARAEDMVAWADQNGMRVVDIVPVGAFLGGGAINHWFRTELEEKFWWKRLLSWVGKDEELFDCALFLEEEVAARLTTRATCRFMAILENQPDPEANRGWLERNARKNDLLAGPLGRDALEELLPLGDGTFGQNLARRLGRFRNRFFLYSLVGVIESRKPSHGISGLLPQEVADLFNQWRAQDRVDQQAMEIVKGWHGEHFSSSFAHHGVPVAEGMEYYLMESVLTHYFNVFSGVRS